MRLDPKDLVGILNDLQSAGLVVREPDPDDRRKNAVSRPSHPLNATDSWTC